MAVLVLGLVTTITGIRQFGDCRVEYWRDRDAGCSVAAYFCATNAVFFCYDHVARALVFSALYSAIGVPALGEDTFARMAAVNLPVHTCQPTAIKPIAISQIFLGL